MRVRAGLSAASEVERMLDAGHSFEQLEEFIERQPISQQQRSALWLLAWAETDGSTRRRVIAELLA